MSGQCRCGHDRDQHRRDEPCPCKKRCRCLGFESPLPGQCEHGQVRAHEFTILGRLPKMHCPGPDRAGGVVVSGSAWDQAVEAAATAICACEPIAGGFGCGCQPLDADGSWVHLAGSWDEHIAESVLAAALPVLLEELAQRIEEIRDSREHFEHCSLTQAAGIVRGFAAEVTQ